MKKIIRIASVIALASASLLYVGCTKDFSADIAKTNKDVEALNQKIETLNTTVQTINSTVENLKTTKADLSAVNAADKALEDKITALDGKLTSTKNDLTAAIATAKEEAIEAAKADAASKLSVAKEELKGVIAGVEAKVDSLNILTTAQTESLREDVDSLSANCVALEERIAELEDKVIDLAARVSSIVAVPSMNSEFRHFEISDINKTFFAATFAVTPKAAVKNIAAENLKVNFKQGLTRESEAIDTTFDVVKVVADEAKGEITAFVEFDEYKSLPSDDVTIDVKPDWTDIGVILPLWVITGIEAKGTLPPSTVYFSLAFAGEDKAGEYEENSEYVKAHNSVDNITLRDNAVIIKDGVELTEEDALLRDTLAFDGSEGTKFASLFEDLDVAFKFNDEIISKEDIAELLDTTFTVVPADSLLAARIDGKMGPYAVNETAAGIVVTSDEGTNLCADKEDVGNVVSIRIYGVKVNGGFVGFGDAITERHFVGAKTVEFTLPAVSEPWTYTSWDKVSRTVSVTHTEAAKEIHDILGASKLVDGAYTIQADNNQGVDIVVKDAARSEEAEDKVDTVAWTKSADIAAGDTVNYTINWMYTLEGRPADETIVLADVDTVATDYTKGIEVAIDKNLNDLTFAAFDAAYDKTMDSAAVKAAIKGAEVELDSVMFNGEEVDGFTTDGKVIYVPDHTKAGAYDVVLEKTVFGIKYTYTYTINIAWKEALKLHPTPYVSAGVAIVDADTLGGKPYTLAAMDMAKYLQVFNADTLAKGFDNYRVDFKAELEDSAKFENEYVEAEIGNVKPEEREFTTDVNEGILVNKVLDWNTYIGREVKITAYLATGEDTVDTYTFTLKYRKPITSFAAGTQEVKRIAGEDAEAVLTKSFDVKGLYHGDKNLIVDTTGAWIDRTNYYGCEILFNVKKAVFKVDGVETLFTKGVDYDVEGLDEIADGLYKAANGVLRNAKIKFLGDNNNKNLELSVPVILGYKYDYNWNEAYKDNVVIKVVNE